MAEQERGGSGLKKALTAYLDCLHRGGQHVAAVVHAAETVAADPWQVVHGAGLLARCQPCTAQHDLALTSTLKRCTINSHLALIRVEAGALYPVLNKRWRKSHGAFDTPRELAQQVTAHALAAASGPVRCGLDPACGTGALLLALAQAGVEQITGYDLDELALAVAQIAVPGAQLECRDALEVSDGGQVDVVVGNPPFVSSERQSTSQRLRLKTRFPWLSGRYDLALPFAAAAVDCCRPKGGVGLILPASLAVQPYGLALRKRWLQTHTLTHLSRPFPFVGAAVDVFTVAVRVQGGPESLPDHGVLPRELGQLSAVPWNPSLQPEDIALVHHMSEQSIDLGEVCFVDTGLVAHGPDGSRERLLSDQAAPGLVPYADARGFFRNERRWLSYEPERMHRAKDARRFERDKIVIKRLRGRKPIQAAIDTQGTYVGHTCVIVQPNDGRVALEDLLRLITSPLIDGFTRIQRGDRLDLYPRDIRAFPVPERWLSEPALPLEEAFLLTASQVARLHQFARWPSED